MCIFLGIMLKRAIRSLAHRLGYEIHRKRATSVEPFVRKDPLAEHAQRAISIVRGSTMLSEARLTTLYYQAAFCEQRGIPGSFVECGVWKGGAVGVMALANLAHGRLRRQLHLFDAFQEICEPDPSVDGRRVVEDVWHRMGSEVRLTGALRPLKGVYDGLGGPGTLAENRRLLEQTIGYDPAFIRYHEGWFQETVPRDASAIDQIAVLRLDGDLYHSTRICLEHLYPKVVTGGFVVVDDYGYFQGCTNAVDEYVETHNLRAFLHPADHVMKSHAYWVKT